MDNPVDLDSWEPGEDVDNDALVREELEAAREALATESGPYQWFDFTPDDSTDAIPDKYILTIVDADDEEIAIIVHRTVDGTFPLDGPVAEKKRQDAARIVRALNSAAE